MDAPQKCQVIPMCWDVPQLGQKVRLIREYHHCLGTVLPGITGTVCDIERDAIGIYGILVKTSEYIESLDYDGSKSSYLSFYSAAMCDVFNETEIKDPLIQFHMSCEYIKDEDENNA